MPNDLIVLMLYSFRLAESDLYRFEELLAAARQRLQDLLAHYILDLVTCHFYYFVTQKLEAALLRAKKLKMNQDK